MRPGNDPAGPEEDRLRGQIRALEEQLQRLVRTEQRLYYSQRDLGRQLRRVESLNRFSIEWNTCRSEVEILRKAMVELLSLLDYDSGVALLRGSDERFRVVATQSAPGRECTPVDGLAPHLVLSEADAASDVVLRSVATGAPRGPEHPELLDALFGAADPSAGALNYLEVRLRDGADPPALGILVFRRQGAVGFHDALATENDAPILEVFGRQVAMGLSQRRLVEDLRQKCAQLANAQRELVERERLAALGELAAVIAHEVRNPVAVIFNSLAALRRAARSDEVSGELLSIVGEEAERLNRLVSDLIDFARPHPPRRNLERLEEIVARAVERVIDAWPGPAPEIRFHAEPGTAPVHADAGTLHQAVVNMLTNALQAGARSGPITVRVGPSPEARGHQVRLEVEDMGEGIPTGTVHRIFDPFFTTRALGTGLGLAVVKKVVDAHGGEVRVRSIPGAGSTFTVLLPAAARDHAEDAAGEVLRAADESR